jgi:cytochrome c-type biogenesis protein
MGLLAVYSLGLGVPFLLAALMIGGFLGFMLGFRRYMPLVEKAMGALLVVTGVMFLTGAMQYLSYCLLDYFPWLLKLT